jgi:hypothetical protein
MRLRGIKKHDLLTWLGATILLVAWIMQQTYLQETADKLSRLNSAKLNTTLLNTNGLVLEGLLSVPGIKKESLEPLTAQLNQNLLSLYEGLGSEQVETKRSEIKSAFGPFSGSASFSQTIKKLTFDEAAIRLAAANAWWIFVCVYLAGGLLTLAGSILKATAEVTKPGV